MTLPGFIWTVGLVLMVACWVVKDRDRSNTLALCAIVCFLLASMLWQEPAEAQRRVEGWGGITHTSNLFRGCPFRCALPELTQDCILGGITLTAGRRRTVELDLSHGLCRWEHGPWLSASQLSARYYPGRRK